MNSTIETAELDIEEIARMLRAFLA
jgi:hypothetical protein